MRFGDNPMRLWLTPQRLLAALIGFFSLIVIGAASFKYARWGQGFDMVDFHMPVWGTLNGKFLLVSRYNFTDTFMGLDVALGFFPALPFYALIPSAYTLIVVQVLLLASAAIPVYLIARDRFKNPWAGLAFAAIYLLYPTTQFMAMAGPFQPRIPALVLFFWAFYALERRKLLPYLLLLFTAMLARTDAALVVVAFGMVAVLKRTRWTFAVWPMLIGFAYFYVAITYVTPQFYSGNFQPTRVELPFDLNRDYNDIWPCGMSPQACYYLHLGGSLGGIVQNILLHPIDVFFFIFQPDKLWYLTLMLGALAFLPLFAPRELLLAAPIFAINLLSNRIYQYVISEQYQILVIPGVVIAAIYGAAWLWERVIEPRTKNQEPRTENREPRTENQEPRTENRAPRTEHRAPSTENRDVGRKNPASGIRYQASGGAQRSLFSIFLILTTLFIGLTNIPLKNPVISSLRNPETAERVALMEQMKAQIPPDAVVAATSFLAPHLLPRDELYYIPGGPMHHQVDEAEYAFIDARASGLRAEAARGNDILGRLRADPNWRILAEADDLILFQRIK